MVGFFAVGEKSLSSDRCSRHAGTDWSCFCGAESLCLWVSGGFLSISKSFCSSSTFSPIHDLVAVQKMDLARWSGAFPQPLCALSRKTGFLLQEQIRKHVCVSPMVKDNSLCEVNLIFISDFLMVSVSAKAKKVLWTQLSPLCSRWRNTPLCFCHGAPLHMLTIFTERMPGSKQSCSCLCVQAADSQGEKKRLRQQCLCVHGRKI